MKKFLPLLLLFVGIIVLVSVFIIVRGRNVKDDLPTGEESALLDLPLDERPLVSLTPTTDGHYLNLKVSKIDFKAFSMDYELVYQVPGGVQQGVPGTINLSGMTQFEAELLLGSESSGKFRYDEGVEEGTLSLRFRDEEGRLLARFTTQFHMQKATEILTSPDGVFSYEFKSSNNGYFVTMNTIGFPDRVSADIVTEVYGIFTSEKDTFPGYLTINNAVNIYRWPDERLDTERFAADGNMPDIGIFAGVNNVSGE